MTYSPPRLLVRVSASPSVGPSSLAEKFTGVEVLAGRGVTVHFRHDGVDCAYRSTPEGESAAFLLGDLHGDDRFGCIDGVMEAYLEEGPNFVGRLHGSFALVIWDGRRGEVVVLTDPLATRAVFHTTYHGATWIANTHAFQNLPYQGMDPVSTAQYLVNGIPMNRRTLLRGVQMLGGASVHRVTPGGLHSRRYWEFRFRRAATSRRDLLHGLHRTLVAAVKRRVREEESPVVSLSGGFDAPAILCALHELKLNEVTCFTYAHPRDPPLGDAAIARDLAHGLGYSHHTIPACRAGLDSVLTDNILLGRALTRLTVETDAWRSVAALTETMDSPTLFVGEEFYGGPDAQVTNREGLLALVGIVGLDGIGRLSPAIPHKVVAEWEEMIRADLREVLERLPVGVPLHDLKDLFYLEERARRRLAWRETFAGEYASPRLPLLDREILELMQGVSTADRRGKRLFREMLLQRFPQAFKVPRADSRSQISVTRWADGIVREESGRIRELLAATASPLDDMITPEMLLALGSRAVRRIKPALKAFRVRRKAARLLRPVIGGRAWTNPPVAPVPESLLLVRALFLRKFFRRQEEQREGCWDFGNTGDDATETHEPSDSHATQV